MTTTEYFCLKLTESEHDVAYATISKFLKLNCPNTEILYYRPLKDGHIPTYREVKIRGSKSSIQCLSRWMATYPEVSHCIAQYVVKNPHRILEN